MSDSLAIAAATETLSQFLSMWLISHGDQTMPDAEVKHLAPTDPSLDGERPTINVYLFLSAVDPFLRNAAQPTHNAAGQRRSSPSIPLKLTYLISFHGDEGKLEPQRLLGLALAAINGNPVLGPTLIQHVIDHTAWLATCDLARSGQAIKLTAASFSSVDELGSFWMNFAGTGHRLAMLFEASVVTVTSPGEVVVEPPVEGIGLTVGRIGGVGETAPPPLQATFAMKGKRLTASVSPRIRAGARCMLALHDPKSGRTLHSLHGDAPGGASLTFDLDHIPPGTYAVRVIADSAWTDFVRNAEGEIETVVIAPPGGRDE